MGQPVRYQFTVRRLLILSTAIAVAFAVAGGFHGPMIFRLFVGVYFASLAAWYVMRWPVIREYWRVSQRMRLTAIQRKREAAIEVAKRKSRSDQPKTETIDKDRDVDAE